MKKVILFLVLLMVSLGASALVYPDTTSTAKPLIYGNFLIETSTPTNGWFNTDYFDDTWYMYDSTYVPQDSTKQYAWYYKGDMVYDKENITVIFVDTLLTDITSDSVTIIYDSLYTRVAYDDLAIYNDSNYFFIDMQITAYLDTIQLDTLNYTWRFRNFGRKKYLEDGSYVRVYPFVAFYMNWVVPLRFASIRELATNVPVVNIDDDHFYTNADKVEVYDLYGRLVTTYKNENVRLLQGLHVYKISKGTNTITRKIYGNRN